MLYVYHTVYLHRTYTLRREWRRLLKLCLSQEARESQLCVYPLEEGIIYVKHMRAYHTFGAWRVWVAGRRRFGHAS